MKTLIIAMIYGLYSALFAFVYIAIQEATNDFVEAVWALNAIIIFIAWSFHVKQDVRANVQ
jgi:hypothetical protein